MGRSLPQSTNGKNDKGILSDRPLCLCAWRKKTQKTAKKKERRKKKKEKEEEKKKKKKEMHQQTWPIVELVEYLLNEVLRERLLLVQ